MNDRHMKGLLLAAILFGQISITAGTALAQSPAALASLRDFLACQAIEKRAARYQCYDALERGEGPVAAQPNVALPPAAAAPAALPPAAAAPAALPSVAAAPAEISPTAVAPAAIPPAPAAVASTNIPPAAVPPVPDQAMKRRDFGRTERAKEDKGPEAIEVQIVSAKQGRSGRWTFRTSDGQLWRQTNSRVVRFHNQSFEAEISKARFGGYYLKPADQKLRLRIKRIN